MKHGLYRHPLYRIYLGMVYRCHNNEHPAYIDYGARGIKVCRDWRLPNFQGLKNFIAWNDALPLSERYQVGLEIDRKNNDKGYSPLNSRWVTRKVNLDNRRNTKRLTIKGHSYTLKQASIHFKVPYQTIYDRQKEGYSDEQCVQKESLNTFEGVKKRHTKYFITIGGLQYTVAEAAAAFDVSEVTIRSRKRRGWSDEQCIGSAYDKNRWS